MTDHRQQTIDALVSWNADLDAKIGQTKDYLRKLEKQRKDVKTDITKYRDEGRSPGGLAPAVGKQTIMSIVYKVLANRGPTDLPTLRSLVLDELKSKELITSSTGKLRAFAKWLAEDVKIQEVESEKFTLANGRPSRTT